MVYWKKSISGYLLNIGKQQHENNSDGQLSDIEVVKDIYDRLNKTVEELCEAVAACESLSKIVERICAR